MREFGGKFMLYFVSLDFSARKLYNLLIKNKVRITKREEILWKKSF